VKAIKITAPYALEVVLGVLGGRRLVPGEVYRVPEDVPELEARDLVRMGVAEEVRESKAKGGDA
jgi:hypothetical protein